MSLPPDIEKWRDEHAMAFRKTVTHEPGYASRGYKAGVNDYHEKLITEGSEFDEKAFDEFYDRNSTEIPLVNDEVKALAKTCAHWQHEQCRAREAALQATVAELNAEIKRWIEAAHEVAGEGEHDGQ